MDRLWIVEAQFQCGTWGICNFGTGKFAATNYHEAHQIKREQQEWLRKHGSPKWYKKCFRVREYKPV